MQVPSCLLSLPYVEPTSLPNARHASSTGPMVPGMVHREVAEMGSGRRVPRCACHQCLIMASVFHSKNPLFSGKKVTVLNYTKEYYALCSSVRLVCFEILIRDVSKRHSSGLPSVCLHLSIRGFFVSLSRDNGCSLRREAGLLSL